jgi:hypothetical protein
MSMSKEDLTPTGPVEAVSRPADGLPIVPTPRQHRVRLSDGPELRELVELTRDDAMVVLLDDSAEPVAVLVNVAASTGTTGTGQDVGTVDWPAGSAGRLATEVRGGPIEGLGDDAGR